MTPALAIKATKCSFRKITNWYRIASNQDYDHNDRQRDNYPNQDRRKHDGRPEHDNIVGREYIAWKLVVTGVSVNKRSVSQC